MADMTKEQFRRSFRDGLRSAGLDRAQITAALELHRTAGDLDPSAFVSRLTEDAVWKYHWPDTAIDAAVDVFGRVGREGAVTPPATPADDAATIADAEALLKKDATAYWRDPDLRERYSEALERTAAAKAEPLPDNLTADVRRGVEAASDVAQFADLMRNDPRRYWGSTKNQADHRAAIEAALATPTPQIPDLPWPGAPTTLAGNVQ